MTDDQSNKINVLSSEILRLKNLHTLNLQNLPLQYPPPEVLRVDRQGNTDIAKIRHYFEEIKREGLDYLYEAKLLVVGEGGAGKTTLTRKLQDPQTPLPCEDEITKGIEIVRWSFSTDDKEFHVNIWDFGGQEIYHATHQFFLTKRSLYILVADSRKEDTDFFYWLNVVELLSDSSPLLILNNKKGDRDRKIDERSLKGRFNNLKEVLASNLAIDTSLNNIYPAIKYQIQKLPHIGTPLPKGWVRVRKDLEDDPRYYITYQEFQLICAQQGITDDEIKANLSEVLHDLGICLHFHNDILLKNWVILKPTWGTDAVYKVLDNDSVIANNGRFNNTDLNLIWDDEQYAHMHAQLLRLMVNFQLCYEIPGQNGNYIAPQLLPVEKPAYRWDETDNLILHYDYQFMPKGIIVRFIVSIHKYIDCDLVWRNGVILAKDDARAEVIEHYTQSPRITIRVGGRNKRALMDIITAHLDNIHDSFERLRFDKLVPCNCLRCKGSQEPHFYTFDNLQNRVNKERFTVECDISFEMVNVSNLIENISSNFLGKLLAENKKLKTQERNNMSNKGIKIDASNGGSIIIGGDVSHETVGGDKAGRDIIHGDKAGRDKYTDLQNALKQWQEQVASTVEARDDLDQDEKEEIKEETAETAEKVMKEAEGKARPGRIEGLLNTVSSMGEDILAVTMATLTDPLKGIGLVLKKINDRVKLESAGETAE